MEVKYHWQALANVQFTGTPANVTTGASPANVTTGASFGDVGRNRALFFHVRSRFADAYLVQSEDVSDEGLKR